MCVYLLINLFTHMICFIEFLLSIYMIVHMGPTSEKQAKQVNTNSTGRVFQGLCPGIALDSGRNAAQRNETL